MEYNIEDFEHIVRTTKKQIVIVDTQWVLYKSHYAFKDYTNTQGMPIGHIHGLLMLLQNLCKLNCEVFLSLEGHCTYREELVSEYKAQRENSALGTMFVNDYGRISDLISDLENIHLIQSDEYESDDVMFTASKICEKCGKICYIHTLDKDLYQAISETTFITNKITSGGIQDIVDINSNKYTQNFSNLKPQELPIFRAIRGDASDNIKPVVERFPTALAIEIAKYMYENNGKLEGFPVKNRTSWITKFIDNYNKFLNNYKIMQLKPVKFGLLPKALPRVL